MSDNTVENDNAWKQESESRRQHLEFIQNVITRMNSNSFQIKGSAILIVTALFTVYVANKDNMMIYIGIFPAIACWFLDAYYLRMERQLIGLYKDIVAETSVKSLNVYGMNFKVYKCNWKFDKPEYCYLCVLFSTTMWLYPLFAVVLFIVGWYAGGCVKP